MDTATAIRLNELNRAFYARAAASFSATRRAPWAGWQRCLEAVAVRQVSAAEPLRVLDLACGNGRFARALEQAFPATPIDYWGVDVTPALVLDVPSEQLAGCHLVEADLVAELFAGELTSGDNLVNQGAFDLSVSFGFMHHVPGIAARKRLLNYLVDSLNPGGICCISLWCFTRDVARAAHAETTTQEACAELGLSCDALNAGDYLLGWQHEPGLWRYCHSFTTAEIDELAASVEGTAQLLGRFAADGATGNLNEYLVFTRIAQ